MSDHRQRLATGSFYLSLDSMIGAFLGGIYWIIVAKLAPPSNVGQANIIVALTSILITFAGLGFNIGASKFIAEHNSRGEYDQSRLVYSKTLLVTVTSSLAITVALVLSAGYVAGVAYKDSGLTFLVIVGALTLPFQALFRTLYGVYQGAHRMAYCLVTDLIFLVLRLILSVALLLAGYGTLGIILGVAAGYLASVLFGMTFLASRALPPGEKALPSSSPGLFRRMFDFSLPNYFATILVTASAQVSIVLLGVFRDPSSAAFYNIALLTKTIVAAMSGSIGVALLPTVAATLSSESKLQVSSLYNLSMRSSILLSSVPALGFFLLPNTALSLIGADYARGASAALQLLMISAVGTVMFGTATQMLNSIGRPLATLWATTVSFLIGFVGSLFTIPLWGVDGAALANLASGVAGALVAIALLSRKSELKMEYSALGTPLVSLTVAVVTGELVLTRGFSPYLALVVSLATLLLASVLLKGLRLSELAYMFRLVTKSLKPAVGSTSSASESGFSDLNTIEESRPRT